MFFFYFRSILLHKHDSYSFINIIISNRYQPLQRKRQKGARAKMDFKGVAFVILFSAA